MKTTTMLRYAVLGLFVLLLLGCSLIAPSPAPSIDRATPTVANVSPESPGATLPPATLAPATPVPVTDTPVPTPTADPCPTQREVAPPDRDTNLETYMTALGAYLSQGGDPGRVELQEQEGLERGDLTGDGVPETVFMLIDPESQQIPPKGHLVVYTCRSGEMAVLYHYEPGEWMGLEMIGLSDLSNDGVADLAFSEVSCGAHTCWHTPQVWSWAGSDFQPHLDPALMFPYPWYTLKGDSLVVVSHGMGSVGAGPQRTITVTLSWTGTAITITDRLVAPPTYRYHAFLDGEQALVREDFEAARAMYERVVDDSSLEEWGAYYTADEEYTWLVALGRWRLMTLSAYLENPSEVEALYATLSEEIAPDTTGYSVVALAGRFWRGYERNGDVPGACNYAVGGAEAQAVADFLNTFGYANPMYEAFHVCPFTDAGIVDLPY